MMPLTQDVLIIYFFFLEKLYKDHLHEALNAEGDNVQVKYHL